MNALLSNTHKLAQLIEDEIAAMSSLAQILDDEQIVLINNEAEKLEAITPKKNQILMQIVDFEKVRNQTLGLLGYPSNNDGMRALLDAMEQNDPIYLSWQTLMAHSAEAQEKNRNNGLLINRQLTRNQQTLNILQQNNPNASMYGADGQSKTNMSSMRGIVAG